MDLKQMKVIITGLLLFLLFTTLSFLDCKVSSEQTNLQKIDEYILSEMKQNHIPGLALGIVKNDQVIYLKGYGKASPERMVSPETPFIIGSVSKSITAAAILQLAEQEKINLDSTVQHYIPWFQTMDKKASSRITIRHLLNHTSGFSRYDGNLVNLDSNGKNITQVVRQLKKTRLNRPVGESYQYSNLNYIVLGEVIQAVSGETYEEYLAGHIFGPLEMKHSFTSLEKAIAAGLATGYQPWFGFQAPQGRFYPAACVPSGYIISSAADLTHYLIANMNGGEYLGHSIISNHGMMKLHEPAVRISSKYYYGMGWEISSGNGSDVIEHPGDAYGFNAKIAVYPHDKLGIIVLENTDWIGICGETNPIPSGIAAILSGKPLRNFNRGITGIMFVSFCGIWLVTTGFLILSLFTLSRWNRRLVQLSKERLIRSFIPVIAADLLIPIWIFIFIPTIFSVNWRMGLVFGPDFCGGLLTISILALVIGIYKIWALISALKSRITSRLL